MVLAVVAAILVSVVSLIPFRVAIKKIRTVDPSFSLNLLGPFLLTIAVSFIFLVLGIVACKLLAPDFIVVYSLTELLAFIVGVIAMGVLAKQRLR